MADETLRRNLDSAFDPGPGFPDRLLLSRTMAALQADVKTRRVAPRTRFIPLHNPRVLAIVAALLAVAIVVTIAFGIRANHSTMPIPGKHGRVITRYHNGQIVLGNANPLITNGRLDSINPVTGSRRTILDLHADVTLTDAAYSQDGTKLAYIRGSGVGFGEPTIWILNIATGHTQLLTTCRAPGCGTLSHLAWSPDGSRLAFVDGTGLGGVQLYLIDADGGRLTQLTQFHVDEHPTHPTWSPDGTSIAFSLDHGFGTPRSVDVISTDGSGLAVLLPNVQQHPGGWDLAPAWAPDGSRIAYVLFTGYYELWLMDPDGSHRTRIFVSPNNCCMLSSGGPAWSPDATKIAVGAGDLWVMNSDGSDPSDLKTYGTDGPTWQPVP
jgi:Tol biopolymer transport system component